MPKELLCLAPRQVGFREFPDRPAGRGELKLRTIYSGISHGTEMAAYRGTSPLAHKRHEGCLFLNEPPLSAYPQLLGYEEVAEVVEVGEGVTGYAPGDVVAAAYGHSELAFVNAEGPGLFLKTIPKGIAPERGIFMALGGVALDSVLTSHIRLGESTVVFGMGLIGLLIVQLCKMAGAGPVVAVDLLDSRLARAREFGADATLNPTQVDDVALEVRRIMGNTGADVCFEVSSSYKALHEAIRCGATYYSKVVAVAFYQGPAKDLYLGEEFHFSEHLAGGAHQVFTPDHRLPPAPGRQWDRNRVADTVFSLLVRGKLVVDGLISHQFAFADAAQAFELIDRHPEECTKVVLRF